MPQQLISARLSLGAGLAARGLGTEPGFRAASAWARAHTWHAVSACRQCPGRNREGMTLLLLFRSESFGGPLAPAVKARALLERPVLTACHSIKPGACKTFNWLQMPSSPWTCHMSSHGRRRTHLVAHVRIRGPGLVVLSWSRIDSAKSGNRYDACPVNAYLREFFAS